MITKEMLEKQHFQEKKNLTQIAKEFGVSRYKIGYLFKKFGIVNKVVAHNREYLIGLKFNMLTVISRSHTGQKNRQAYWNCLCDCGKYHVVNTTLLKNNTVKSCGCLNHKSRYRNPRWKGVGEISRGYLYQLEKNAVARNIVYRVSPEYIWQLFLSQNRKCNLSGIDICFCLSYRFDKQEQTASLDRIDSSQGYIEGNVQWIHKQINHMKSNMNEQEFIKYCNLVSAYLEKN